MTEPLDGYEIYLLRARLAAKRCDVKTVRVLAQQLERLGNTIRHYGLTPDAKGSYTKHLKQALHMLTS